ncbi:uncharacterized protein LOC123524421 isoform X3 [Mercenaria mercenaria]|uniref:uncharacterized protein LOC123524421 isoform X3 n=1 Tax=Mercenaria mercenaria TaxID=6596 RepID=UPI00234E6647|nr:uncharacterized protein LOC123524421 isoform X3 [Mercenaria mercenaria]
MALLKVGSKAPVFVTHLEFIDSECQIFCQVGDIGGQADTLAERVTESVENGLAAQISGCNVGDLCLALFHEDKSWYRARVLQNLGHSLKVFFIDYGNTEIVKMTDMRAAPDYVLAIPALSTKCVVSDCTPLSGVWTDEEKKKIETMLHSGEFTCEIMGTDNSDANNEVYTVKLYNNDAPNTPIFVRPAPSSSQSLKLQNLSIGLEYEVYVAYVESARKFWVQLKSHETDLNSLMADIGACFAEDLPSTGDIVNPTNGQVCAACFSDDGAFYRGIVKNVQGGSCSVFFVDYGNKEEKRTSELFTLPQALCMLPMQAVPCSYKVESQAIEDKLHKLAEDDGPSVLKVLSGSANSGYVVEIKSVEKILNMSKVTTQTVQAKSATKMWQSYTSVAMQVDGIYDVCLSHVEHPGQFYVQLLGNASNLDKLMQAVDEVAHNYDKLTNLYQGYPCLAKFSDGSWYRGEVVTAEVGKTVVAAVDFGFIEEVQPSQLRNTDPNFKLQPAQAVQCTIDMNKTDQSHWKTPDIERFKAIAEKSALVAKVSSKKGCIHQVDLYETENGVERDLNAELSCGSDLVSGKMPLQSKQRPQPVAAAPTLCPPEVSVGSTYNLCFTAVKSLYIYGQLTSTPVEKVAKLQTDLNSFFEKRAGETLLKAEVGSVCCTQYVDGGWYRGMVTSVSGGKAEVAFVDFGDSVMKSVNDLKVLPPSLCGLPQQCILCKIVNLPQSAGPDKLEKLVNKRVEVKLNRKEDGMYPTYGTEITDRQVIDQLQDAPVSRPAVFKGASSRTFGRAQKDDMSVTGLRNMSGRKPSGDGYSQQEVAVNSTQEVMVTYVKDPNSFQVVLEKMNTSLDVVMDQLHEYYDKLAPGSDKLENPILGQPCIAQFTEDKGWYRAVITGLKADGQAEVMYVDYGNNEYTDKDALKQIKQQFLSLPAQAVQCRLSGVSSPQGFWSPEHIVQFTEMVEEQSFVATFKAELRDQGNLMYKVELVDKKGTNINQKFGTMTGTTCPETDSGPSSRSVSASKLGQAMKITVTGSEDSGWDEGGDSGFGNKPRSFGSSRQPSGGSSGFGARSSGFGSKQSSSGGDSGWEESGSGGGSSGFGSKKPFGSSSSGGGGFGSGGGGSGFGKSTGFGSSGGSDFGGGGTGSKDCFKCGESGHFSRECPNAAKGGAGGGRDCYKCGESGHMARDCTNPPKGGAGGGRDCYKCGESGHMARDCTNPPKAGGGGGGGRDCYKCGECGHMARDCTNPPKAGFGGGGGGRDCYKCGESGHMARDCTNPPKAGFGGSGGGRDCYKCGESGHMARDCTNPPKEGAGPKRGFGGGGDRSSGGGFGNKSGGFGARADTTSEDWGDGTSKGSSSGGFSSRGGGGFGGRGGDGASHGGGFGSKPGDSGRGFGARGGGGFGTKSSEDDWGSGDSSSKSAGGSSGKRSGFGGDGTGFGRQSSGFGKRDIGGGGDDWDTKASPVTSQITSQAGDGSGTSRKGKDVVFSSLTLDTRETVDVYVVYVTNPEQFWCQIMKNCPSLEQLMEEMNMFYNSLPEGDLSLERPEIGMPCAAKFSEDNMWYRAEIITPSQLNVEVQFVDYGNIETVAADRLKQLKPEFIALKTQGIKCGLDDIVSTDKIWTKKAIEDFEDLTHDKHLVAKVINRTSDMTHILDLENLDEKKNIAEVMCEKGYCRFRSMKSSPVKQQIVKNPYPLPSLQSGQELDVYVSWIENPEEFWIQPVSQENELIEFVERIQELTTGAGADIKTDSLIVGQAVVAQFTEDEAWYRGYVEKLTGGKCKVRFTDYGNSDMVESVRIPTDELLKESSHALMCKLVGVRPLQAGQWTADARDIMDGLVKDEVVKCKVVDISKGHFSVELVSKGVDVRQELIQAAVVRGEKETSPVVSVGSAKSSGQTLRYSNQVQLNVGTTEGVFVSHTDSVASFWCQPVKTAAKLEDVMAQLETYCKSGTGLQDFPMDMACAAKFSEDDSWYRAKVTAAYPDSIEVLFVDYGNTEKVLKSDVCELTEELVQLPPQAVECELMNSSKASNQLTTKFTELIGEQEVQATVVDLLDNSAVVHLTLPSGKDVGEELGLSEPGSTPKASPVRPAVVAASSQKSEQKVLVYPRTEMPTEPTLVFVTQIINAGVFYIQQADKESQLNKLMAEISKYCQTEAQNILSPKVGEACCAKFSDDGCWYRAKIVKIDGNNCSVEFVDYGNLEATTFDNIKSITEPFVEAAPFVLQCSLEGIVPMDVDWSEDSVKKFEELAVGKDLSCEVVQGSEVILKCDNTDIAEALVESGVAKRVEGSTRATSKTPGKHLSYNKVTLPVQTVDVYVSHVISPGDFFVQLVDQEEKLNQLMEKISQIYESSADSLKIDTVLQGQAVCAKYSEDEAWYRAEVTQIEGNKVTVLFVDYGNSEETTITNLRQLEDDIAEIPPYAVRCNLDKVKPAQGEWSEESGVYFEAHTSEKVLQCQFLTGSNVCLILDSSNVVDALLEKGYACVIAEIESPSKQKGQFTLQTVPADSVSCYVSHVDDSGTLYIQLVCEEDTLSTEVDKVQTLESNKPLDIEAVKKGDLVCARFTEDQSWYRAVVTSTCDDYVTVRFVDYGNSDEVKQTSDLRALPEDHQVTPPLAYACGLQGLKKLNSSQVELLREVTADKELTVTFITSSPQYEVQLEDENHQDIAQILTGESDKQVEECGTEDDHVEVQVESAEVPQDTDVQGTVPDVNIDDITDKINELESEKLAVEQRVKVVVSHSESPSKFWVQLENEKVKLDNLLITMYDFYNACTDSQLSVESVIKDMLVAALYPEDESWYRAQVVNCDNKDQVEVVFIDHGNTEVIASGSLRKLPTQFCELPIQGLECCLGAVQPSQEDWSEEVKEAFTQLTADKVLLLDVGSIDEQGVYKVQLLDMGMSIGDQLLQKGIGVQIATPVAVSTKVKQVFSPDTTEDVIARLYAAKSSTALGQYGYKLRDLAEADPTISSHNVLVTSISSPVDFWCRLQDNSYDFYQDKLQEIYCENREQLTDISKGNKCVISVEDKEYHRGAVLGKSDNGVDVKLVDIGKSVTVSESNVFKLMPEFDAYPQLAFCCSFTGMVPVNDDRFTEEACKVFKDTVLELSKEMELPASAKATVVKENNGIILVELTIDRKDIAESLVEKGIAKFDESTNLSVLDDQNEINDVLENFGAFKNVHLDIDNDFDVVLIDCCDINRLVFHSNNNLSVIEEIEKSVAEAVSDKVGGEGIDDLTSGPCLAKCPADNLWKRANIRGISKNTGGENTSDIYKVFLVDYGSTYELPISSILPIPDSLLEIPGQAVICHLAEIEPVDGEWNEECYDFFTEHYMSEDTKLVAYISSYNRGIHEMFLSSRNQGEQSVNHLLVDLGMAAPVVGSQIEMSILADTAETSFHELSMSRQDSYGDSSELGETSYEPESSYLAETSVLTEGDTSCLTESDTSRFPEGDTSCLTAEDTSYLTEGDSSCLTGVDTSCVTEGDTSQLTEGDTSQFTEGDTSQFTEGDTSQFTEGDTSQFTEVDTSQFTEGDTSQFTEGDTSHFTEGDTSQFTEGDTSQFTEVDTSQFTEGDTSHFTERETTDDISINTLDGTHWVCEDCSGVNEVDEPMVECQHCHSVKKENESVDLQQVVREELFKIHENLQQVEESSDRSSVNEDIYGNIIESLEDVTREIKDLEKSNLEESKYSTSDVDPRSTEESDIDISYRQFDYSPTGYTTSELDTTDLKEVDESTDTADFDTTELTDYDTTGIEGGGEDLSTYEEKDFDTSIDKRKHESDEENGVKKLKIDPVVTDVDICKEVILVDENKSEIENNEHNIAPARDTDCMLKEDKMPLFVPISLSSAVVTKISQGSVSDQTFPSVSDTTYPSTLTSVSDFTFTSAYDTSQTDSMICGDCKQDFSSCLETTGCESEFSFYLCSVCQQDRISKNSESDKLDANSVGEKVVVQYIEHDENVQRMIEVANEVFAEEENREIDDVYCQTAKGSELSGNKDLNDNEIICDEKDDAVDEANVGSVNDARNEDLVPGDTSYENEESKNTDGTAVKSEETINVTYEDTVNVPKEVIPIDDASPVPLSPSGTDVDAILCQEYPDGNIEGGTSESPTEEQSFIGKLISLVVPGKSQKNTEKELKKCIDDGYDEDTSNSLNDSSVDPDLNDFNLDNGQEEDTCNTLGVNGFGEKSGNDCLSYCIEEHSEVCSEDTIEAFGTCNVNEIEIKGLSTSEAEDMVNIAAVLNVASEKPVICEAVTSNDEECMFEDKGGTDDNYTAVMKLLVDDLCDQVATGHFNEDCKKSSVDATNKFSGYLTEEKIDEDTQYVREEVNKEELDNHHKAESCQFEVLTMLETEVKNINVDTLQEKAGKTPCEIDEFKIHSESELAVLENVGPKVEECSNFSEQENGRMINFQHCLNEGNTSGNGNMERENTENLSGLDEKDPPKDTETKKNEMGTTSEVNEAYKSAEVSKRLDTEHFIDTKMSSSFSNIYEHEIKSTVEDLVTKTENEGEIDVTDVCDNAYEVPKSDNLTDILDSYPDNPTETADGQYISEGKTDEKSAMISKTEDVEHEESGENEKCEERDKDVECEDRDKDVECEESDKDDFEDAHETEENTDSVDMSEDLNTSSQDKESIETGDNESFYDADEEDKKE